MIPITGCAIGTGLIFAAFQRALAFNPEAEDSLFQSAIVGFALVETFMVIIVAFVFIMIFAM